jgi:hypothetical protein
MAKPRNTAAAASQSANASGSPNPNSSKLWLRDDSTKRVSTTSNPALAAQIQDIEKSTLPAAVKSSAIAGLKAQQAAEKPLALAVCRATQPGTCDLIEVSGAHKAKMLSPRLVGALVADAAFVQRFLAEFNAADE